MAKSKNEKSYANEKISLARRLIERSIALREAIDKSGEKLKEEYEDFESAMGVLSKEEYSSFIAGYALVSASSSIVGAMKSMKILEDMGFRYGTPRVMEIYEPYERLQELMPDEKIARGYIEYYNNVIRTVNAMRNGVKKDEKEER